MKTSSLVAGICSRGASSTLRTLSIVAVFILTTSEVHATTYYWDPSNGNAVGAGSTPTGFWDANIDASFSTSPSGTANVNALTTTSSDDLFFVAGPGAASGNGAYTVEMFDTESAHSLNFQSSGAVTFAGDVAADSGTINLGGGGINIPLYAFGTTAQGAVTIGGINAGSGGITLNLTAAQTWTNQSAATLTIAGQIIGGAGLTIKGRGVVNLTDIAATNAPGTINVGDNQASGSLGGNLVVGVLNNTNTSVQSQNELGTGAVNVNYGGFVNIGNTGTAFAPSNNFTVNQGGSLLFGFSTNGTTTPTGLLTLGNLATVGWGDTNLGAAATDAYTVGTTVTGLPNAGAISFNGGNVGNSPLLVLMNGAYGALSNTLAIGGAGDPGTSTGNRVVFSTASSLSTVNGSARTLALNTQGDGSITNAIPLALGGLVLNAPLTITGSGNAGLMSAVAPWGFNETGALTTSGGTQSVTIALSPAGAVGVPWTSTGTTGNTGVSSVTVNSGWLGIDEGNGSHSGTVFPSLTSLSTGITLNGGGLAIAMGGISSGGTVVADNISIGTKGGSIDAEATGSISGVTATGATATTVTGGGLNSEFVTLSGAISGSGALNLISGRQAFQNSGSNYGSELILTGNNSGFTGNITLVDTGGWNGVKFVGTNASGTSNTIFAPNGTVFAFGSTANTAAGDYATAVALLPKFSFSAQNNAIFAPTANMLATGQTLNLSNTGTNALNFSGQIGFDLALYNGGTENVVGAITPHDATAGYRFAITGNATTLNFNTANVLTGTFPVDFSQPADSAGQVNPTVTGAVNITTSQNFTGAFSMNGVGTSAIAYNPAMVINDVNGAFTNTVTIGTGGDLPNATGITLVGTSKLVLGGTTGKVSSTNGGSGLPVTVEGGSILQIGDTTAASNNGVTNRLGGSTAAVTLGGTNGGGELNFGYSATTATSQTLGSLSVGTGASAIDVFNTAASTLGITIASGTIGRSTGGTLYLPFPTSGNFTGITLTGATTTTAAVNGWMYIPTTSGNVTAANFAGIDATGHLIAYSDTTNTVASGNDWVNTSAGTVSASVSLNTLNFNTAGNSLAIASGQTLTLATGGILVNKNSLSISGGTGLTSTTNELIVNNVNGGLTISTPIVQHAGSNINLTKLEGPAGGFGSPAPTATFVSNIEGLTALNLSSGSNALGNIWISGGTVEVSTAVGSLGTGALNANTVTLEGGGLYFNLGATSQTFNQQLVVEPRGTYSSDQSLLEINSLTNASAGETTTLAGNVTLNGTLQLSPLANGGTIKLGGNITGAGALMVGYSAAANVESLVLSGANTNFSGGIGIQPSSRVRLESTTAAGTGQITVAPYDAQTGASNANAGSNNPSLYLGTGASGITLANDVINISTLADWNTGSGLASGGTTETYSGHVYTVNGLTFQGTSTGTAHTSETVLGGSVSVNGIPQIYNFSSTPTTTIQNFVNGQGGINLGVTSFVQNTLLNDNTSTASAMAVDAPAGSGAIYTNGAQGFVTFGGANSFLPGSTGPGYLAALAVAGAGSTDEFGYMLSGTSGNGGSTYAMPEGKSFLIGSLGSGSQVSGILGVTGGSATLLGGPKAAAGQTLTGFSGGDIDVQANGATDNQSLELLARTTTDTLTLGGASNTVVFTPTYGDSGSSNAITLVSKRTGTTTINKIGTGTVVMKNVAFTNTDGTDASANFGINVQAGTLVASGTVSPAVSVASGATLSGTGSTGFTTINSGGNLNLRDGAIGTLTVGGLTTGGGTASAFSFDIQTVTGTTTLDSITDTGTLTLNGAGGTTITIGSLSGILAPTTGLYNLITYSGTYTGSLSNLSLSTTMLNGQPLSLVQGTGVIELQVGTPTTSNGMYTVTTAPTSLNVHANGGTTTVATIIANTGTGTQDALNYNTLTSTVSSGGTSGSLGTTSGTTSGSNLAQGANNSPGASQTFTSTATAGNVVLTNSSTVTNVTASGTPAPTNTGATINVYSGLSTWITNGSGSWGILASGFGTNWGTNQGSPGLDGGFTNTDTATFGSAATSGTATISLNGASPSLKAITFNDSAANYVIAQGSSGTITLKGNGGNATVTDTAGTHTISAPVSLASTVDVNVATGQQLTLSGIVSGSGTGLNATGPGTLVLSNADTYNGNTTIAAGTLALSGSGSFANSPLIDVGNAGSSGTILDLTALSSFSFGSGQTLGGIGTVNIGAGKTVTVNGHLAPGNSIGTLAVTGNLALGSGDSADFQLGTPGTHALPGSSDRTTVSGTLALGGTLNATDNAGANGNGTVGAGSYLIFTQSGTPTGSFTTINAIGSGASVLHPVVNTATSGSTFLDVDRLATATAPASSAALGNVRVGTALTGTASVANSASSDGFTELLKGTVTGGGSGFTGVAGGSSGTLHYSLPTTVAGTQSGSNSVTLASTGAGTFADTTLSTTSVSLTGAAYDFANAKYTGATLSFGLLHQGATAANQTVAFGNQTVTNASFQDLLNVSASTGNANVTATGFTGLGASASGATTNNLTLSVNTASAGSLASTESLTLVSNANGVSGLSNGTATVVGSPTAITTTGQVYSGLSTWATNGSGSWGTLASGFGTNWGSNQGSPGLDSGFTNTDTATFGSAATSGTATVSLNGASPSLKAVTFNDSAASYVIAQGSSGNITLKGNGGNATVTDTAGTHTISAPVSLATSATINVASGQQLTISGQASGTGGLTNTGSGTTVLSNSTGNTYQGVTAIQSGIVYANNSTGSATGTGNVTVGFGDTAHTGTLAGSGNIGNTSTRTTVTVSGGGTISSGAVQTGAPNVTPGSGLTFTNTTINVSGDAPATLTFALGTDTTSAFVTSSGPAYDFAHPSTNSTYMTLASGSTLNFAGVDSISLIDETAAATLTLRQGVPYLLVSAAAGDSAYTGLITVTGTGPTTTYSIDGDGYVLGVLTSAGVSANLTSGLLSSLSLTYYTPISINQFGADGVTPLGTGSYTANQVYAAPALYLSNGDLEVVPEPGTWALMLGGLALLVFIQRRRHQD